MLLEKPIAKNDIVSIKLITGEEILGVYKEETAEKLTLGKPATIAANGQGMGIIPWMMTTKAEKIELNKTTVIAIAQTDEQISKAYTEATTNIQLS